MESEKKVLATIKDAEDPFIKQIKALPGTRVLNVTEKNRDGLAEKILTTLDY